MSLSKSFLPGDSSQSGSSGGGSLLAAAQYDPGVQGNYAATSATLADIDSGNLVVTFTVPSSGKVLVTFSATVVVANSTSLEWGLREGSSAVAGSTVQAGYAFNTVTPRITASVMITGLTPGESKTWKWAAARITGTGTAATYYGGDTPAILKVETVPL